MTARPARRRRLLLAALIVASLSGAIASVALADLAASGNLFVAFEGGISPTSLPRHAVAPVSVQIAGKVRTLSGERPPALRQMVIELNREGRLDTRGLPICRRREVESVNSSQARARCGDALVGDGAYVARLSFPEQESTSARGKILAFNSTAGGKPAIVAQVYSPRPAPITAVLVFRLRRGTGAYGTVLDATVPEKLDPFGYLKRITLQLHRTYVYRGQPHSYLSAKCPAPGGLREASFNFAHVSMTFVDGRVLQSTISRTCQVAE